MVVGILHLSMRAIINCFCTPTAEDVVGPVAGARELSHVEHKDRTEDLLLPPNG